MAAVGRSSGPYLEQSLGLGKTLTTRLRDGRLEVEIMRWGNASRWSVRASALDPNTTESSWRNGRYLIAALVLVALAALSFACLLGARRWTADDIAITSTVGGSFVIAAIGCVVAWWRLWRHCVQVHHISGDAVLTLGRDKPSKEAVDAFLDSLLSEAREEATCSPGEAASWAHPGAVATEIRRFHDLWRRGTLTEDEFRAKKRELLRQLLEA